MLRNFLVLFFIPLTAWPFKIDTHVWIAQDALNNIERCSSGKREYCVRIKSETREQAFTIPTQVAEAILEFPEYYRNGNIGPDAYPDILVGQTVLHPGITKETEKHKTEAIGFGTGEWLGYLLQRAGEIQDPTEKKKALAFVYGMLAHAAADVFAHSYVNAYAGDDFLLDDGDIDVELRHIALETFISQRMPGIRDASGNSLPALHKLLKKDGELAIPVEFIRDNLIFDKRAIEEYSKAKKTTLHLILTRNLREEIRRALEKNDSELNYITFAKSIAENYRKKAKDLLTSKKNTEEKFDDFVKDGSSEDWKSGGTVQDLEIVAIQILAYYYLDLNLTRQQAAFVAEEANQIHEFTTKLPKEIAAAQEKITQWSDEAIVLHGRIVGEANKAAIASATAVLEAIKKFNELKNKVDEAAKKHADLAAQLATKNSEKLCNLFPREKCEVEEKYEEVIKRVRRVQREIMRRAGPFGRLVPRLEWVDEEFDEVVEKTRMVWDPTCLANYNNCKKAHENFKAAQASLNAQVNAALAELRSLESQLLSATEEIPKAMKKLDAFMANVQQEMEKILKRKEAYEADLGKAAAELVHGHRVLLEHWQENIENAMSQWVIANGKAMYSTMDEDPGTGFLDPIQNWLSCYLPAVIGIPQVVQNVTMCPMNDVKAEMQRLSSEFEKSVQKVEPKLVGRIIDAKNRALSSAPFEIARALSKPFNALLGSDFDLVLTVHIAKSDGKRRVLDDAFQRDSKNKNLLLFDHAGGSISTRVESEMDLRDGKWNPDAYPPIVNARTLVALSLLDKKGLADLGGQTRFAKLGVQNIIVDSVRSIDGSYQWMDVAPPYPRRNSVNQDPRWAKSCSDKSNVLRRYSTVSGFPLFREEDSRREIFEKIFSGPLNPGLFEWERRGFRNLLPADYPFLPTRQEPFPFFPGCR